MEIFDKLYVYVCGRELGGYTVYTERERERGREGHFWISLICCMCMCVEESLGSIYTERVKDRKRERLSNRGEF